MHLIFIPHAQRRLSGCPNASNRFHALPSFQRNQGGDWAFDLYSVPGPDRDELAALAASLRSCDPNPCLNGGSCVEDFGGLAVCSCATGFAGVACEMDVSGEWIHM